MSFCDFTVGGAGHARDPVQLFGTVQGRTHQAGNKVGSNEGVGEVGRAQVWLVLVQASLPAAISNREMGAFLVVLDRCNAR